MTSRGARRDVALAVASGALACWVVLSAVVTDAPAGTTLAALAWGAATYVAGRLLAPWRDAVAAAAGVGILVWVTVSGGFTDRSPTAPPLGYANADAALVVAAAGLLLVAGQATPRRRVLTFAVTVAATGWAVWMRSAAAALGLVLLLGVAALAGRLTARVTAWAVGVAAIALVAATAGLGAAHAHGRLAGIDEASSRALSERRVALWGSAVDLAAGHPVVGVGPQQFPERSDVAARDADTRAAHSLGLELAAETGLVGPALLALLVGLVLAGAAATPGRAAVVSTGIVGAFLLGAGVDYVADFPATVGATALAAGLATSGHHARRRRNV